MNHIYIRDEVHRFIQHLRDNKRVIFSAKFGDGKTYFLDEVRRTGTEYGEFVFVTLYPVNYPVALNEDIFEYIKRDILLQFKEGDRLFNTDVEAVFNSVLNQESIKELVSFLISFLPKGDQINKVIDVANKWFDKKAEVDKGFEKYESYFKSQRAGLYEEDAYTKYIQRIIKDIQDTDYGEGKKVVLIIEDLDRLDPAHLFRLLNVIAAHIDQDKDTNKFGFDNIVLVMDYDCTQHIFKHFYGEKANYAGYMSKFSSNYIYHYSIHDIAVGYLYSYFRDRCQLSKEDISKMTVNRAISQSDSTLSLSNLIEKLSVRDIAACLDNPEISIKEKYLAYEKNNGILISTDTPLTRFLAILMRIDKTSQISKDIVNTMLQDTGAKAIKICKEYLFALGIGIGDSPIIYKNAGNTKRFSINRISKNQILKADDIYVQETISATPGSPDYSRAISNALRRACRSIPDFEARK